MTTISEQSDIGERSQERLRIQGWRTDDEDGDDFQIERREDEESNEVELRVELIENRWCGRSWREPELGEESRKDRSDKLGDRQEQIGWKSTCKT